MSMNGNPHADEVQRLTIADATWEGVGYETADAQHVVGHIAANTQATLALAYEQRTANLIALATMNPAWYGSTSREAFEEIDARLGINEAGATE